MLPRTSGRLTAPIRCDHSGGDSSSADALLDSFAPSHPGDAADGGGVDRQVPGEGGDADGDDGFHMNSTLSEGGDADAEGGPDGAADGGDGGNDASDGGDAGDGGGDASDGPTDTQSLIRAVGGSDCLACALTECIDTTSTNCEVVTGAAQGVTRTQLCLDTLRCTLTRGCMYDVPNPDDPGAGLNCYCGDVTFGTCSTTPDQGACQAEEQTGLESTDPTTVVDHWDDDALGGGMANIIADCLAGYCETECKP